MKFYNRENELKRLRKEIEKDSKRSSIVVLVGRRRIGKTRLILEAFNEKTFLYFYVGKKKMSDLLREWTDEINDKIGKIYGEFKDFSQLSAFLFDRAKGRELIVFFDEVQNFLSINPSAFSDLQKQFDLNRESSSLKLFFAGSAYSLVEKIFTGSREPLFGRASEFIRLNYLSVVSQKKILEDCEMYSGENLLHAFSIFDGIPRYYEEIFESRKKTFKESLKELLVEKEFLWEEGLNIMREEFGKEYSIYHSILSAIALGKRTRNEIEQFLGGSAGGYLHNLEKIYRLVKREKPIFSRTKKNTLLNFYLGDNFFEFWFRFISRYQALREINQTETAFKKIWEGLPKYEGIKLEELVRRIFIEINPFNLEFTAVGRYWDRKGENEIDIILLDEDSNTAHVVEVKRNLNKSLKKEEKIKFYNKIAAVEQINAYHIHYYFAGIDNHEIVIKGDMGETFTL